MNGYQLLPACLDFVFQAVPESRKAFDGQGFGTSQGVDFSLSQRGGNGCGGNSGGTQVVGQRLAFLRKTLAYEAQEGGLFNVQLSVARGKSPAKDGGMNLRRRRESRGWQGEEPLGRSVHLNGDREQAIIARAGLGNDAIGHFALHHKHGSVKGCMACGQLEQYGRGDAVGKGANHQKLLDDGGRGCRKIELQYVLLNDRDALRRKLHAQAEGQLVVQLDSQHVSSVGGQGSGYGAMAGTDLDHGTAGQVANGGRDALDGLSVDEEILAELGLGGHRLI